MTTDTITTRVARGTVWLDDRYPGWWKHIDLGTLKVASCHQCVLAQVYNQVVPADEKAQILGQVVAGMPTLSEARTFAEAYRNGGLGSFNVMYELHQMAEFAPMLGFSVDYVQMFDRDGRLLSTHEEFDALTDEWTKVILGRRLDEHPDVRALTCREPVAVG